MIADFNRIESWHYRSAYLLEALVDLGLGYLPALVSLHSQREDACRSEEVRIHL
jgi:hypothetical protein